MKISKTKWGNLEGKDVYLITMHNGRMEVSISNYGCTIVSISVPDHSGNIKKVVLGYDSLQSYVEDPFYVGCIVGRVSGRISNASFTIGDLTYALAKNDHTGKHHLHGGVQGFNKKVFDIANIIEMPGYLSLELTYQSRHLEEGYPGTVDLKVCYTLTTDNELKTIYSAVSDRPTHLNLTNHSYFNLSGGAEPAINHHLIINADEYLKYGSDYIPTGELMKVENDPRDFRNERPVDQHWDYLTEGFNEYFILNKSSKEADAELFDLSSGIRMSIKTSFPGILLYTGDYLQGAFLKNQGLCLETQLFPDSANQKAFPTTLLRPGDNFNHWTIYKFLIDTP